MNLQLTFTDTARKDIELFKKSGDKSILKKLHKLLIEISEHPTIGTGKPEQLKHELSGKWSRKINREHRIVYEILEDENRVVIYSTKGHY
jgi:toxin YoeB